MYNKIQKKLPYFYTETAQLEIKWYSYLQKFNLIDIIALAAFCKSRKKINLSWETHATNSLFLHNKFEKVHRIRMSVFFFFYSQVYNVHYDIVICDNFHYTFLNWKKKI